MPKATHATNTLKAEAATPAPATAFDDYGEPFPYTRTVRCPCDAPCRWVLEDRSRVGLREVL